MVHIFYFENKIQATQIENFVFWKFSYFFQTFREINYFTIRRQCVTISCQRGWQIQRKFDFHEWWVIPRTAVQFKADRGQKSFTNFELITTEWPKFFIIRPQKRAINFIDLLCIAMDWAGFFFGLGRAGPIFQPKKSANAKTG